MGTRNAALAREPRDARNQRSAGIVAAFCIVLALVIWGSIAVQLNAERANAVSHAMHETAGFARVFEEHVLRTMRSADLALRHVEAEYRKLGRKADLAAFAADHHLILEPYRIFAVMDERGELAVASRPFKRTSYAHSETFRHHATNVTDELFISRPEGAADAGTQSIILSRRISKPDGSFAGVVSLRLDPTYFSRFYDQVDLGKDAVVVLVGMDGIIRARKKNADASAGQDLSGFESFKALKGRRAGNFIATRTLDGVRRFFAYRVLEAYPLVVQVGMAEDVMFASYHRMRTQFVVWAGVITALLALFVALFFAQAVRQSRLAAAIQASESRYRSFITATSRIVWGADSTGRVVADSQTWRAYTGQTLERYIGAGWLDAVHPEDRERVGAAWRETVQKKSPRETEVRLRGAEGSYRTFRCRAVPVLNDAGTVHEWVAVLDDLTDMRQAEAERAHLAHIVQTSDDAIISRSLDHIILSWNAGAERLFGYTAQEAIGREISLIVAPEGMDAYLRARAMSSAGKPPPPHETDCIAKDGRRLGVWISASAVHDERGELVAISLILRDITDQKALASQQRLAASVFESAAEGIMITDCDQSIVAVNRAFTDITGFTAEDVIGKDRRLMLSAAHPSSGYEEVWEAVKAMGRWRGEVWDRRKNGELYCGLLSVTAVRDESDKVVHYCAIMMDISQRKAAEAELQRLNAELENRVAARTRQLESANNELAAFSYSVSHDLRAPVRAIEGFSSLVLGKAAGQVDAETFNRLHRIRDNAQRMGLLIDDLLRLSRVSQRELDRREFDLSALAGEIVSNLRRQDASRSVHVDVDVQPGMTTCGDPALVQLVLENLIGNAWKFTSRMEHARIEVGCEESGSGVVYFVRDNGAGFDMQYADKLFNAFQRLHRREDFEGTGIGLSIVHRVIVKHGGRVWADARVGEGATFFFTLS